EIDTFGVGDLPPALFIPIPKHSTANSDRTGWKLGVSVEDTFFDRSCHSHNFKGGSWLVLGTDCPVDVILPRLIGSAVLGGIKGRAASHGQYFSRIGVGHDSGRPLGII